MGMWNFIEFSYEIVEVIDSMILLLCYYYVLSDAVTLVIIVIFYVKISSIKAAEIGEFKEEKMTENNSA